MALRDFNDKVESYLVAEVCDLKLPQREILEVTICDLKQTWPTLQKGMKPTA